MRLLLPLLPLLAACAAGMAPADPRADESLLPGSIGVMVAREAQGLIVTEVSKPAADAGLRKGDLILRYNGAAVDDPREFNRLVLDSKPSSSALVELLRDGAVQLLRVPVHQLDTTPRAALAKEREARRLAELERARAERELAELKRRQAEARQPLSGKVSLPPSIAARALEPAPQAAVEPANLDPAALAWQLSDDLRRLHTQVDVQTFYTEHGSWVLSLAAETLFEPGEASLRSDARGTLDRLARVLRHYAARGIAMEGPDEARAQALKRALTERGIPGDGIAAGGTGERIEFLVPHAQVSAR